MKMSEDTPATARLRPCGRRRQAKRDVDPAGRSRQPLVESDGEAAAVWASSSGEAGHSSCPLPSPPRLFFQEAKKLCCSSSRRFPSPLFSFPLPSLQSSPPVYAMVVKKQGGGYCGAGLAVRRSGRRLPSRRRIWRPAPLPPPPTSLPPPDLAACVPPVAGSGRASAAGRRIWPHARRRSPDLAACLLPLAGSGYLLPFRRRFRAA
ncbi:hypothetical protein GUJ93_ZPchr0006g40707 [Zizania palustris]|uniref:Uncharacterized protein n=1 Tax=Zizania palustris TaxID=103762 RepID=A0A8J5W2C9_ZIZPA|nr:hypothetical protein GUJ93_ZPchr0006g40707 [Zizania palustris]